VRVNVHLSVFVRVLLHVYEKREPPLSSSVSVSAVSPLPSLSLSGDHTHTLFAYALHSLPRGQLVVGSWPVQRD
jgi:hypothetical protein